MTIKRLKLNLTWLRRGQAGMSSFIVVATLAIILSLISIGSIRVSNRNLNSSLSTEVGRSAEYAAESGVNQTINFLQSSPNTTSSTCAGQIGSGKAIANANLSTDTTITCALISSASNLVYSNISTGSSKIVNLKTGGNLGSVEISWRTYSPGGGAAAGFPLSTDNSKLNTELTWNSAANNYPPVMQVTFYCVPAASSPSCPNNTSGTTLDKVDQRTVYLVPFKTNAGSTITAKKFTDANVVGTTQASIVPVDCAARVAPSSPANITTYQADAAYDCNVIIYCLNPGPCGTAGNNADHFDLRILPIYKNADVKIQGKDGSSGNVSTFANAQSLIDITAKSGVARRRIQARVSFGQTVIPGPGSAYTNPEYNARTAGTLCKRLAWNSTPDLYTPVSDMPLCPGIQYPGQPPAVALTVNGSAGPITVNKNSRVNLAWTVTGVTADSCQATQGTSDWTSTSPNPAGGSQSGVGPLTTNTTYGIRCHNTYGWGPESTVLVNVPTVTLFVDTSRGGQSTVDYGFKNTFYWTVTPAGYNFTGNGSACNTSSSPAGGWGPITQVGGASGATATSAIPAITTPTSYSITCFDETGQAYPSNNLAVSVNKPVLRLTPASQTVVMGNNATIAWDGGGTGIAIKNADSCTPTSSPAQANWNSYSGWLSGPGQMIFSNVQASFSVTLTCTGGGGSTPKTASVTAVPPPPSGYLYVGKQGTTPTKKSAVIGFGKSANRLWHVINATSCTPSANPSDGDWSTRPTISTAAGTLPDGSYDGGTYKQDSTLHLVCTGPGGTASIPDATINVLTVSLLVDGQQSETVASGSSVNRSWTVNHGNSCVASSNPADGDWGSNTTISLPTGSTSSGHYSTNTTLTLSCNGNDSSNAVDTAQVNIGTSPPPPPPPPGPPPPGPPPPPPPPSGGPGTLSVVLNVSPSDPSNAWNGPECPNLTWWCGPNAVSGISCPDGTHPWTVCFGQWQATADSQAHINITSCTLKSFGRNLMTVTGNNGYGVDSGIGWFTGSFPPSYTFPQLQVDCSFNDGSGLVTAEACWDFCY